MPSPTHKVTHLCGAPIVMSTLLNAPAQEKKPLPHVVEFVTAAAPPPEAVLAAMKTAGFNVTHVYGLTETYGPASINDWHDEWDALPPAEQAAKKARQGVRYPVLEALDVLDPETMQRVPRDGETLGEVMFRGNVVMKGYLKNKSSTEAAFAGGWFHSGDLGVVHPDGYIQLKDRSKDIIISGGENISSIEVEDALYKHPAVAAVGRGRQARREMGRDAVRLRRAKARRDATADELIAWCRSHLAAYKCPRHVVFAEIPKTIDRQDCRNSSCARWRRGCDCAVIPRHARARPRIHASPSRSKRSRHGSPLRVGMHRRVEPGNDDRLILARLTAI